MRFTSEAGIMFAIMMIPFAIDALVGIAFVYQSIKKSSSDYVCVNSEPSNRRFFPEALQPHVDRLMETEFYQVFCH